MDGLIDVVSEKPEDLTAHRSARRPAQASIAKAIVVCKLNAQADAMVDHLRANKVRCAVSKGGWPYEARAMREEALWNIKTMTRFMMATTAEGSR